MRHLFQFHALARKWTRKAAPSCITSPRRSRRSRCCARRRSMARGSTIGRRRRRPVSSIRSTKNGDTGCQIPRPGRALFGQRQARTWPHSRRKASTAGGRLKGRLLAEPARLVSVCGAGRAVTARHVVFINGRIVKGSAGGGIFSDQARGPKRIGPVGQPTRENAKNDFPGIRHRLAFTIRVIAQPDPEYRDLTDRILSAIARANHRAHFELVRHSENTHRNKPACRPLIHPPDRARTLGCLQPFHPASARRCRSGPRRRSA